MADYALAEAFVQIRPDTTGFRADAEAKIKAALAGINPEVKIKIKPDLAGFSAAVKAALASALGGRKAAQIEVPMRVTADEGSINTALRLLKQRMTQMGVVDFLDYDLPVGKIQFQIQLLKRLMAQANLSDFLAVNLKPGQALAGAANLRDAVQRELKGVSLDVGLTGADIAAEAAALKAAAYTALGGISIPVTEKFSWPAHAQPWPGSGGGTGSTAAEAAATAGLTSQLGREGTAAKMAAAANAANNAAMGDSAKTTDEVTKAMSRLHPVLTTQIPLWGGLAGAAGLVQIGFHAAVEGFIAIVPAAAALAVTLYGMLPAAQDVYNHLQAIDVVNTNLGSSIPPLTGKFAALQAALAPAVVELYGGGLNLINRNSGILGQTLTAVSHILEGWIANIDIWAAHQANIGRFLQTGVAFLRQWGQVLGELGVAVFNLSKADPGIAHLLMDILIGALKVLDVITKLPTPLLTIALGLHGVYIWGGLAATALGKIAAFTGFDTLATKVGLLKTEVVGAGTAAEATKMTFLGLSGASWAGILALAAAIGYVAFESTQADSATKRFLANLDNAINNLPASQALSAIPAAIGKIRTELVNFQPPGTYSIQTIANQARVAWTGLFTEISQLGHLNFAGAFRTAGRIISDAFTTGQANTVAFDNALKLADQHIAAYVNGLGNLGKEMGFLGSGQDKLTKGTLTGNQALALMDLAGVQASDSFAVMRQKVDNLITGYNNMSVSGSLLSNSVDAVTLSTEIQASKITALTSGWTAFFSLVTGGLGGFTTFEQDLVTLTNKQLPGLSSATLTTQQNFLAAAQAAQTEANALLQQASAAALGSHGTDLITSSVKDMVAQLLPAAKGSQNFTTILYTLAQQGGYTGANSFKALSKWVDTASGSIGSAKNPSKQLDKNISTLAADSANLVTDMNNLSNAISQNLNQAMGQAILQVSGGTAKFVNFYNAVVQTGLNSQATAKSALSLATGIFQATGSVQSAKGVFETFAERSLGLTKSQADTLWKTTLPGLQGFIDRMHGKNLDVNVMGTGGESITTTEGGIVTLQRTINGLNGKTVVVDVVATASGGVHVTSNAPGSVPYSIFFHAKSGGKVPGHGAGDIIPALLEPGEVVVDKARARTLGPLFKAMGVRGYSAGGLAGSIPGAVALAGGRGGIDSALADRADAQAAAAELRRYILGLFTFHGGGGGVGGATPGVQTVARFFMANGANRAAAAGIGGVVAGESGGNPEAVQAGGGGMGILQWTPGSSAFPIQPIITGNPNRDMGVQLIDALAYVQSRGGLGPINLAGLHGPIQAAQVMSAYEAPAVPGSDIDLAAVEQLYAQGLDHGGWLPPGKSVAINRTGGYEMVVPPSVTRHRAGKAAPQKIVIQLASSGNAGFDAFMTSWLTKATVVRGGGNVQAAFGVSTGAQS